jgi:hypothetical protein
VNLVLNEVGIGLVNDGEIGFRWKGVFEFAGEGNACVAGTKNNDVHTYSWGASRMNMALDVVRDVAVENG